MIKSDGGPAFAAPTYVFVEAKISSDEFEIMKAQLRRSLDESGGMSLRAWFAGQSMDVASKMVDSYIAKGLGADMNYSDLLTHTAFDIADRMIKKLEDS